MAVVRRLHVKLVKREKGAVVRRRGPVALYCFSLGRLKRAEGWPPGETLTLTRSFPQTPFFDLIPIASDLRDIVKT